VKYIILLSLLLNNVNSYSQKQKNISDTLTATLSDCGVHTGDTSYFEKYPVQMSRPELIRFFNKTLHIPTHNDLNDDNYITGKCKVYFIIDKAGRVTQAWYDKSSVIEIALEVIRVINKIPVISPSIIKGQPVITKVEVNAEVRSIKNDENNLVSKNVDLLMLGYPAVH
jgi:hypothetical protein